MKLHSQDHQINQKGAKRKDKYFSEESRQHMQTHPDAVS